MVASLPREVLLAWHVCFALNMMAGERTDACELA
jgi:hypothetical protein